MEIDPGHSAIASPGELPAPSIRAPAKRPCPWRLRSTAPRQLGKAAPGTSIEGRDPQLSKGGLSRPPTRAPFDTTGTYTLSHPRGLSARPTHRNSHINLCWVLSRPMASSRSMASSRVALAPELGPLEPTTSEHSKVTLGSYEPSAFFFFDRRAEPQNYLFLFQRRRRTLKNFY